MGFSSSTIVVEMRGDYVAASWYFLLPRNSARALPEVYPVLEQMTLAFIKAHSLH
jgi:hypothetical protein